MRIGTNDGRLAAGETKTGAKNAPYSPIRSKPMNRHIRQVVGPLPIIQALIRGLDASKQAKSAGYLPIFGRTNKAALRANVS